MAQNKTLLKLIELWGSSLTHGELGVCSLKHLQVTYFNLDFCENIVLLLFFFLFQMAAQIQFWMT